MQTAVRAKSCSVCQNDFVPFRSMQQVCGPKCARQVSILAREREKAQKRLDRARLDAMRPLSHWMRRAQSSFNAWVRLRDSALSCISCNDALIAKGKAFRADLYHAGHYLTTGARPGLRFDERNVHKQCAQCNLHLHGNASAFRIGLVARIGVAAVEILEADQSVKQYRADDLKAIRDEYRARAKALALCQ